MGKSLQQEVIMYAQLQRFIQCAPDLSREEEIAYGETISVWRDAIADGSVTPEIEQAGLAAANALAVANQRYLTKMVVSYCKKYPLLMSDDVWTTGFLALFTAAKAYRAHKGYFWAYAKSEVFGAFQNLIKGLYPVSMSKDAFVRFGKVPDHKPSFSSLELNEEITLTRDDASDDDDAYCPDDLIEVSSEDYDPTSREGLTAAISQLPSDQQDIVTKYYGYGCEAEDLGALALQYGITRQAVAKRRDKALKALQDLLKNPELLEIAPTLVEEPESSSNVVEEPDLGLKIEGVNPLIECPNCQAQIPLPIEGDKVACSECYAQYIRFSRGPWSVLKSGSTYALVSYAGVGLPLPHRQTIEQRLYEQERIRSLNALSRIYDSLEGDHYATVRASIKELFRETMRYREFDPCALERVETWVEGMKNPDSS
jgi:RNA polymerase sigma factor (sigma-70 family)